MRRQLYITIQGAIRIMLRIGWNTIAKEKVKPSILRSTSG